MTMLNALLFLLLLLAGAAAAFILEDLHRAEVSAFEALTRLDSGHTAPEQPVSGAMAVQPVRPIRLVSFFTLDSQSDRNGAAIAAPADALRFDFALAAIPQPAAGPAQQECRQAVSGPSTADLRQNLGSCA